MIDKNRVELFSLISKGDSKAFEIFVNTYYQSLYSYACQLLRNKLDAEEIVLDVFVVIWRKRSEILKINNIKAYLYRSVKNKIIDFTRASKRVSDVSLDDMFDNSKLSICYTPENELISKDEVLKINNAIESLPKRSKEVLYLVKNENLSYKEVAKIMSISVRTVENQMAIVIGKLAVILNVNIKHKKNRDQILHVLLA